VSFSLSRGADDRVCGEKGDENSFSFWKKEGRGKKVFDLLYLTEGRGGIWENSLYGEDESPLPRKKSLYFLLRKGNAFVKF